MPKIPNSSHFQKNRIFPQHLSLGFGIHPYSSKFLDLAFLWKIIRSKCCIHWYLISMALKNFFFWFYRVGSVYSLILDFCPWGSHCWFSNLSLLLFSRFKGYWMSVPTFMLFFTIFSIVRTLALTKNDNINTFKWLE